MSRDSEDKHVWMLEQLISSTYNGTRESLMTSSLYDDSLTANPIHST